jgi:hypothetical protein
LLADLAFYGSSAVSVTPLGAALFTALGFVTFAGGLVMRVQGTGPAAATVVTVSGVAIVASSVLALHAVLKLGRAGLAGRTVGPLSAGDRRFRLVCIIFMAVVTLFVTVVLLAGLFGDSTVVVDPAMLPPGHRYVTQTYADGARRSSIDCPSAASWIASSDRDPLCAGQARTGATVAIVCLAIDGALVAGMVALRRSRRRSPVTLAAPGC